ncbi:MAG: hypothetical protein EA349_14380 [Halomonadaceae bacterium]|nr:MAG: hypothetical protein EA349_14380 [Halomonadaceae bacterium]
MRRLLLIITCLLCPVIATAQQPQQPMPPQQPGLPEPEGLGDRWYLGVIASNHEHRSLGRFNDRTDTQAASLIFGRFLNDHFLVELRAGGDFRKNKPDPNLEIHVEGYISAYVGLYYPWSTFSALYAQFGVSGVEASAFGPALDTVVREKDEDGNEDPRGTILVDYTALDEDYLSTRFSPSFLLGVDLQLSGDTYLTAEYGRLHRDSLSGVQIWQSNIGLRWLF